MITLKTLPNATSQEVFDQVSIHLLTQKSKSINEDDETGLYRDEKENKCAAGCLIADDEYSPEMEGSTWNQLVFNKLVPDSHSELISDLQRIHDLIGPSNWVYELTELGDSLGLKVNHLWDIAD